MYICIFVLVFDYIELYVYIYEYISLYIIMSQDFYSGSEAGTEPYSPRTTIKSSRSTKKYPWDKSPPKPPNAPVPRLLTPELPVPRLVPQDEFKLEMALKNAKKAIQFKSFL